MYTVLGQYFWTWTFVQQNHFIFWLKYVLRPNFHSANWLSERLSQKVKSSSAHTTKV